MEGTPACPGIKPGDNLPSVPGGIVAGIWIGGTGSSLDGDPMSTVSNSNSGFGTVVEDGCCVLDALKAGESKGRDENSFEVAAVFASLWGGTIGEFSRFAKCGGVID